MVTGVVTFIIIIRIFLSNVNSFTISNSYNASEQFGMAISMDLYESDSYAQKYSTPITVDYTDYIYVGINEDNSNTHFKFVVTQCFATPTSDPNGGEADIFFDNKCSLDGTFSAEAPASPNDRFNFKIQAFNFIESGISVYFNCRIYICKTDSAESDCSQTCTTSGQRWRRNTLQLDDDSSGYVVTTEAITLNDKQSCEEISESCPTYSSCFDLQPARCVCNKGYVFSREQKRCVKERLADIKGIHLEMGWKEEYANTSSMEFQKLAMRYENLFYYLFQATGSTNVIEGIKVIKAALKNDVILDVRIIHKKATSDVDAHKSFIKSITSKILKVTTTRRRLKIIENHTPILARTAIDDYSSFFVRSIVREKSDTEKVVLIIVVALLSIVALISGIVIFKVKEITKRPSSGKEVKSRDNEGLEVSDEA